jgi:hypothetical protein
MLHASGREIYRPVEEAIEKIRTGGWKYEERRGNVAVCMEKREVFWWNGHDTRPGAMHRPGEVVS